MKYLFIAAIKEEIDLTFLEKYDNVEFLYTGIGKTKSVINLLKFLSKRPLSQDELHIINIGTCGSSRYVIGDVISINHCKELGCSMVAENFDLYDISDKLSFSTNKDAILSSDFFISSQTLSDKMFSEFTKGYTCFDMEIGALAKACKSFQIRLSSIKIVSDNLNSSPRDWHETLKILSPKLKKIIEEIIHVN